MRECRVCVCVCGGGVYGRILYTGEGVGVRHCVPAEFIVREESGAPGHIHIL